VSGHERRDAPGAKLHTLSARRVLRREPRGSSSPIIVDTEQGPYLVKLRGAAQGPAALVAEIIVGALADRLGLAVPSRAILQLAPETPTDDRNDELADLLARSTGDNLGFQYLEPARTLTPADLADVSADWASQVRWLDWLVLNPDRTARNPNILVVRSGYWLIDHGAALPFQHDWAAVTEHSPERPEPAGPHLFAEVASRVPGWDPILTSMLPREALIAAVDAVPASLLAPLIDPAATTARLTRRRAAYVAFLWKRLQRRHHFHGVAALAADPPGTEAHRDLP
jgi:hypothetical protein